MNRFTIAYIVLGLAIFIVEMIGVFGHRNYMDTISDHVWWVRDKVPVASRIAIVGILIWLGIHFTLHTSNGSPSIEPPIEFELVEPAEGES